MNHSINPCVPEQINQREVSDHISYLTKKGSGIIKVLTLFCTRRYSLNTLYPWSWKKLKSIISLGTIITFFSTKSHLINNGFEGTQKGLNIILGIFLGANTKCDQGIELLQVNGTEGGRAHDTVYTYAMVSKEKEIEQ